MTPDYILTMAHNFKTKVIPGVTYDISPTRIDRDDFITVLKMLIDGGEHYEFNDSYTTFRLLSENQQKTDFDFSKLPEARIVKKVTDRDKWGNQERYSEVYIRDKLVQIKTEK